MNEIVVSSDKRFGRAILGLNKTEVYDYLNQISSAYEELQLQIQVLKEQNNKLSDSNRENALKLYNLQNDVTEAQKKSDRANAELETLRKENASLKRDLDAAEKRISKLTDELIKTGADIEVTKPEESRKAEEPEEKGSTPKPEGGFKDIFADLRSASAKEEKEETGKEEKATEEPSKAAAADSPDSNESIESPDGEEVYAGEVEVKVDESMLIGNDDDEEEGFTFL